MTTRWQSARTNWMIAFVFSTLLIWGGCDSPSGPSSGVVEVRETVDTIYQVERIYLVDTVIVREALETRESLDTVYLVDTVTVRDTVRVTGLPSGTEPTRLGGSLAWGGGPAIGSSRDIVARLPNGRWGIGIDAPQSSLHIRDGDFRLEDGSFQLLVSGAYQGENPAGYGLTMNRLSSGGTGPMGISLQQDGLNYWGMGLDANTVQPYPDYVSVFETAAGDVFRFRSGGRALLGNGIGHPESGHVLTVVDRQNNFIENVLNLDITGSGSASRFIRAFGAENEIAFAVGRSGRVGVGRDVSATAMLSVAGDAEAWSFLRISDERLKVDVTPISGSLDRIRTLRPVSFRWRDSDEPSRETGLVAQEVARVLPDAVRENGDGYKTVDYNAVSIELVRAVQELTDKVERLEAELGEVRGVRPMVP